MQHTEPENTNFKRVWWRKETSVFLIGIGLILGAEFIQVCDTTQSPINSGDTSVEDDIAIPEWLVEETLRYDHAGQVPDQYGDEAPCSNTLTIENSATHVAYLSTIRFLGGFSNKEFLPPLGSPDRVTRFGPRQCRQGMEALRANPFISPEGCPEASRQTIGPPRLDQSN